MPDGDVGGGGDVGCDVGCDVEGDADVSGDESGDVSGRRSLDGKVALVAGATRGAGRGIAAALGEAGATVICTGRSSRAGNAASDYDRSETIEETAELVTSLGGTGVPVRVDHLEHDEVRALADRVRGEFGHLDVLVNDIWGGEQLKGGPAEWNTPIWQHDLDVGLRIVRLAVETHLVTSHFLLPLLVEQPGGLLVEVTDGTTEINASSYRISVFYDLAKASVNRLAFSQGHELAPHGASAVAVTPGWLRSEMMLEHFGVTEDTWRDALDPGRADGPVAPEDFATSETPRFVGRGIAALAADPERAGWNQRSVTAGDLARAYGVTDVDGTCPDSWARW
ncbi:SDR family oxidoreductase [Prauserella halophila]|uniref:SDR family oxidoreductase n=1 Tax=Prauserella halophila TaxID=185641 RepID=A0ABP4GXH3_9PSEU|nr:SDR family oxidoreductase [Prauserella halophila]MCP2237035.1 NAD(P)-dependent dehydrogenase, short-chain alcohol dehydrogenase family [Prauserella halophila]